MPIQEDAESGGEGRQFRRAAAAGIGANLIPRPLYRGLVAHVVVEIRVRADRNPIAVGQLPQALRQFSARGTGALPTQPGMTGMMRKRAASISIRTKSPGSSSRRLPL